MFKRFNNYPPQNEDIIFSEETELFLSGISDPTRVDLDWAALHQFGNDVGSFLLLHLANTASENVRSVASDLSRDWEENRLRTFTRGIEDAIGTHEMIEGAQV